MSEVKQRQTERERETDRERDRDKGEGGGEREQRLMQVETQSSHQPCCKVCRVFIGCNTEAAGGPPHPVSPRILPEPRPCPHDVNVSQQGDPAE